MANIRKNVNALTSTEKQNFIQAIKALKANGKYAHIALGYKYDTE